MVEMCPDTQESICYILFVLIRKISLIASMLSPEPSQKAYRFSKLLICVMVKIVKNALRGYTNYYYTNYELHKTLQAVKNIRSLLYDKKDRVQKYLNRCERERRGDDSFLVQNPLPASKIVIFNQSINR